MGDVTVCLKQSDLAISDEHQEGSMRGKRHVKVGKQ
jgi:hypothetical protein